MISDQLLDNLFDKYIDKSFINIRNSKNILGAPKKAQDSYIFSEKFNREKSINSENHQSTPYPPIFIEEVKKGQTMIKNLIQSSLSINNLKEKASKTLNHFTQHLNHQKEKIYLAADETELSYPLITNTDSWEKCNSKISQIGKNLDMSKVREEYKRLVKHQKAKIAKFVEDKKFEHKKLYGYSMFEFNQISPGLQQIFLKRSNTVGKKNRRKFFGVCANSILEGKSSSELSKIYDRTKVKKRSQSLVERKKRKTLTLWERIERSNAPVDKSFFEMFRSKKGMMLDFKNRMDTNMQNSYKNYLEGRRMYEEMKNTVEDNTKPIVKESTIKLQNMVKSVVTTNLFLRIASMGKKEDKGNQKKGKGKLGFFKLKKKITEKKG